MPRASPDPPLDLHPPPARAHGHHGHPCFQPHSQFQTSGPFFCSGNGGGTYLLCPNRHLSIAWLCPSTWLHEGQPFANGYVGTLEYLLLAQQDSYFTPQSPTCPSANALTPPSRAVPCDSRGCYGLLHLDTNETLIHYILHGYIPTYQRLSFSTFSYLHTLIPRRHSFPIIFPV